LERLDFPSYSVKAHEAIVNAVDGMAAPGAPEFVTCSRDGTVKVWDPRQPNDPVAALIPSSSDTVRDCWSVAFGNGSDSNERCVAAGYDNGDVKLFDLRMNALRWETNVGVGVCSIEFDRQNIAMNKLLVTGLSGVIRVYDLRTLHPEKGYAHASVKTSESDTRKAPCGPEDICHRTETCL
jgi:WD40 repeat protein